MSNLELRPRLASEIVDAAFQLYRRHFVDLITLTALFFAPYILLQLATTGGQATTDTSPFAFGLIILFGWAFGSLAEAAIVVAVSNSYLTGRPDVPGALRLVLSRIGRILAAITAKWALIGLALLGSVMVAAIGSAIVLIGTGTTDPGTFAMAIVFLVSLLVSLPVVLWFYGALFAVPATVVLERNGVWAGLGRSRALSSRFKRKVYGALGIPTLLFLVMQLVVGGVFEFVPLPQILRFLGAQAAAIVVYPILSVIATLLYYDARIRKEGFDIEVMAADLAPTGPSVPPV